MKLFIYRGTEVQFPKDITHAIVHESVTAVDKDAFQFCQSLVSLVMHDEVESIGEYACSNCGELQYVRLSKKLKHIQHVQTLMIRQ